MPADPPPAHEIDEVAVDRAVSGDRAVTLNPAELQAAFQQLNARGLPARRIAETLGVSPRTIIRWRRGRQVHPCGRTTTGPLAARRGLVSA